jgi:hypothetical protein
VLADGAKELASAALGIDAKPVTAGAAGGGNSAADAGQIYAPGSILRVLVDKNHAVGRGMSDSAAVYSVNSTSLELPAGSAADIALGSGRVTMFGFRPLYPGGRVGVQDVL